MKSMIFSLFAMALAASTAHAGLTFQCSGQETEATLQVVSAQQVIFETAFARGTMTLSNGGIATSGTSVFVGDMVAKSARLTYKAGLRVDNALITAVARAHTFGSPIGSIELLPGLQHAILNCK